MITKFIIKQIFKIESKEMIVLSGDLLSESVFDEMYLSHNKKEIFIRINSIESVTSKLASIGLTFIQEEDSDFDKLLSLECDDIVDLVSEM